MACCNDLLRLIRRGLSPAAIIEEMKVSTSHFQRMLKSRKLLNALRMEADLARAMLSPQNIRSLHRIHTRLTELAVGDMPETARKACETLLEQARSQMNAHAERLRRIMPPWMQMEKQPPEEF